MEITASSESADEIASFLVRVYEIHEVIIEETGGLPGLREASLLHSAVARPFATFDGQDLYTDLFEKAAALFHSLIKNHPFMDGTKRTALAATLYFLAQHGHALPEKLPIEEVVAYCVAVAEENMRLYRGETHQQFTVSDIAVWLEQLTAPQS